MWIKGINVSAIAKEMSLYVSYGNSIKLIRILKEIEIVAGFLLLPQSAGFETFLSLTSSPYPPFLSLSLSSFRLRHSYDINYYKLATPFNYNGNHFSKRRIIYIKSERKTPFPKNKGKLHDTVINILSERICFNPVSTLEVKISTCFV